MKKLLLFSACVILAFVSCKKSDSNKATVNSTITATIGGTNETFSNSVTAQYSTDPSIGYNIGIAGFRGTGTSQEGIELDVNSSSAVTKGTYTITSTTSGDAENFPLIVYYKNMSSPNQLTIGSDPSGTNVTTITITSISSTNVQGTFSAVLVNEDTGTDTQTVTNGKFNVNITPQK